MGLISSELKMSLGGFKGQANSTRQVGRGGTKTASTEAGGGDHRMGRKAMTPLRPTERLFRSREEEERLDDTIAETR
jgi:hypothetical protein